ncbi:hypothetical protein GCM10011391_09470 [Pullulanibacillus camelliae]|uniref:Uncharacterized protein n=1 Tax=Pullulanibacillus camelliae TaxID=1707096 RepID=A0A8J2VMA0_9BACL|nr:hypothetical protein [Pullulanibacillus camelliae]GGE32923.1 hypothetical protein GCM10011391_09470 [Pullulanibacillus camelliae]
MNGIRDSLTYGDINQQSFASHNEEITKYMAKIIKDSLYLIKNLLQLLYRNKEIIKKDNLHLYYKKIINEIIHIENILIQLMNTISYY